MLEAQNKVYNLYDFKEVMKKVVYVNCEFHNCNFAELESCVFVDCRIVNCNFKGLVSRCHFIRCVTEKNVFSRTVGCCGLGSYLVLDGCVVNLEPQGVRIDEKLYTSFDNGAGSWENVLKACLVRSPLPECFQRSVVTKPDVGEDVKDFLNRFQGRFDFSHMVIEGVDFSGLNLGCSDFTSAKLLKCNFVGSICTGADFRKSELINCDFTKARIKKAQFDKAFIRGCLWKHADLRDVNFLNASVGLCSFAGANLFGVKAMSAYLESKDCDGVPVVITSNSMQIGTQHRSLSAWEAIEDWELGTINVDWWRKWKPLLLKDIQN